MTLQPFQAARLTLFLFAAASLANPILAQRSDVLFRSIGLEPSWTTNVRVPYDGIGVVSVDLWLDAASARTYAVAELPDRTIHLAVDQLDHHLQPTGMETAAATVRSQASRILGRADGFEVTQRTIGQLVLVVTTRDGLVQCLDAETGKLRWAMPCGETRSLAHAAALSQSGVAVAQGDTLHLLDWISGRELQRKKLPNATASTLGALDVPMIPLRGAQPEASGDAVQNLPRNSIALSFDLHGQVRGYSFNHPMVPWTSRVVGRPIGAPVSLPDRTSVAVATSAGWLYVFSGGLNPTVQFRYESGSGFGGSLAAGANAFYAADFSGTISKVSTLQNGSLVWTHRLLQSITAPPQVDSDSGLVVIATDNGGLYAINDSTGHAGWNDRDNSDAQVRTPIAISGGAVICRTFTDSLAAFDLRDGQLLGQTPPLSLAETVVINSMTDRVYLLGLNGRLQCYRPIGKTLPKISAAFVGAGGTAGQPTESTHSPTREPSEDDENEASDDPMEDEFGSDPFGGGADESDPFGDGL